MTGRHFRSLATAIALILPAIAQAQPMSPRRVAAIDLAVREGMARVGAKGMALAVIENGNVGLVRTYGARNAAGDPLQADTIMYGASLTKAVFAYFVMQLVDEGRIDLDKPIAALLPRPLPDYGNIVGAGNWGDLAGDDRWRAITPRMVLTHSTGFANFAFLEPDGRLRIHFDPGTRYAYSGEGIQLLQFAIEQGLGLDIDAEIKRRIFIPLGMTRTSLTWRPDFAANLADGWTVAGQAVEHDRRSRVRAAGSMDTTIADIARFAGAMIRGTSLSARGRTEIVRPQLAITTATQFPTLQPDLPRPQRHRGLSAGLGVETFHGPQGPGFYKGGHNDSTGNMMICVERRGRCLVVLGNDVRVEALFPSLVRKVLGETGTQWSWKFPDLIEAATSLP